jgi:twinkle protein
LMEQDCTIGYIALEENNDRTMLGFMGIHENLPLHTDRSIDVSAYRGAYDWVAPKLYLYDNFGSTDVDTLYDKIRYLVRSVDCDVIVLDHLSMIVSGISSSQESDERRFIDNLMTGLRSLVEELQCCMVLVSHLRRPQGDRGYEQGQETSLNALRGSAAIAQLSDAVVGLERDQQGDNPNHTTVRVLKNRYTGDTGVAGLIEYQRETGRLRELATGNQSLSSYDFADSETYGEF